MAPLFRPKSFLACLNQNPFTPVNPMTKKVYLIEDDKRNMKLFMAILKLIPECEVFTETRGNAGLELITQGEPDLVILDIQLPGMSGIEICRELKAKPKFKDVPFIAVTSFAMKGDKKRILEAGFDEYLSKPIQVAKFRDLVRQYVE